MLPITQTILTRKSTIIRLFWLAVVLVLTSFVFLAATPSTQIYWDSIGRLAGKKAALFFLAALTPGILKRFAVRGLLQDAQIILMAFRRQLGIAMYLSALVHSSLIYNLAFFLNGLVPKPENLQQLLGTLGLTLTLPLFLTSNNFSQKHLKRFWDILHKLVYLILWLIFGHLLLIPSGEWWLKILLGLYIFLEIASFFYGRKPIDKNNTL